MVKCYRLANNYYITINNASVNNSEKSYHNYSLTFNTHVRFIARHKNYKNNLDLWTTFSINKIFVLRRILIKKVHI